MEGIERYHAHLGFRNEGPAAGGERSPVLAVLPVVAGPALAHVAARGLGAVHAGRHVPAGIHVTRVHTPPPEVPCGDRPALPHPGTRLSHRRAAFRRGGGGGRPSARGCVRNLQPPRDPPSRLLCRGKPRGPRNHRKLRRSGGLTWKHALGITGSSDTQGVRPGNTEERASQAARGRGRLGELAVPATHHLDSQRRAPNVLFANMSLSLPLPLSVRARRIHPGASLLQVKTRQHWGPASVTRHHSGHHRPTER